MCRKYLVLHVAAGPATHTGGLHRLQALPLTHAVQHSVLHVKPTNTGLTHPTSYLLLNTAQTLHLLLHPPHHVHSLNVHNKAPTEQPMKQTCKCQTAAWNLHPPTQPQLLHCTVAVVVLCNWSTLLTSLCIWVPPACPSGVPCGRAMPAAPA